jgi:hypothetical protein
MSGESIGIGTSGHDLTVYTCTLFDWKEDRRILKLLACYALQSVENNQTYAYAGEARGVEAKSQGCIQNGYSVQGGGGIAALVPIPEV